MNSKDNINKKPHPVIQWEEQANPEVQDLFSLCKGWSNAWVMIK
ncbi:MAG: hypothetical protein ACOX3A_01990 [bacterium]|jgi:hypothetical protein